MIITPDIIKDNPSNLYLLEIAYLARPQHCRKPEYWYPNIVTLSTKWYCCNDDRSLFKEWQLDEMKVIWAIEMREIQECIVSADKAMPLIISDDFGLEWSQLKVTAPKAWLWITQELKKLII